MFFLKYASSQLRFCVGITGNLLLLIKNFHKDRQQLLTIGDMASNLIQVTVTYRV